MTRGRPASAAPLAHEDPALREPAERGGDGERRRDRERARARDHEHGERVDRRLPTRRRPPRGARRAPHAREERRRRARRRREMRSARRSTGDALGPRAREHARDLARAACPRRPRVTRTTSGPSVGMAGARTASPGADRARERLAGERGLVDERAASSTTPSAGHRLAGQHEHAVADGEVATAATCSSRSAVRRASRRAGPLGVREERAQPRASRAPSRVASSQRPTVTSVASPATVSK